MDQETEILAIRERVGKFLDAMQPKPDPRHVMVALAYAIGNIAGQAWGSNAEEVFLDGFNELMERVSLTDAN